MNAGGGEAADQLVRMMLTGGEITVRLGGDALKNLLALTMALAKNHKKLYGKVNMRKMLNETRDVRVFTMTPEQYKQFHKLAGKQKILFSAIKDADGHGLVDVVFPVTEIERANMIFERIKYHGKPEHPQQPEQTDQPQQPEPAGQPDQSEHPEQSDQPEQSQQPEQVEQSEQRRPESVTPEGRNAEQEPQNPSSPEQPEKTASETKDESRSRLGSPDTRASFDTPRDEGTSRTTNNRSEKRNRPSVEGRLRTYQAQIQRKASAPARRKTKFKIRMKNRSNRR